ncbi:unnamed protein product [Cladocopium goreaui]|uniref:Site-specific DNA-methyltransferase (Cytosine-N(4)-specific) n=1 Tax=Cladocopium goreaui TaxID=2562237 RepID=A0A9P1CDB7_9DINO|nr:unnamed protein product [Cladocopium goreaui]
MRCHASRRATGGQSEKALAVVAAARTYKARESLSLLKEVLQLGEPINHMMLNAVLTACAKQQDQNKADVVLREMHEAMAAVDTVSFNIAMNACAQRGDAKTAATCFDTMMKASLQPDIISFNSMLKANRDVGVEAAEYWIKELSQRSLQPSEVTFGSMLDACARAGKMDKAKTWLERMAEAMLQPSKHCYTSLVKGAATKGDLALAEHWMQKMEADGYTDEMSYGSILQACSASASVEKAEKWFRRMLSQGLRPNAVVMCSLLNCYAEGGEKEGAERWLQECPQLAVQPDVQCYGAVMKACANAADATGAGFWMQQLLNSGLEANTTIFNSLINACARASEASKASKWFDALVQSGSTPDAVTFSTLVNASAKLGDYARAEQWVDVMSNFSAKAGMIVMNSVINACAQAGEMGRAEQWLAKAQSMHLEPDAVSYNGVLNACAMNGQVSRAETFLDEMLALRLDDIYTYNSLINVCAENGAVDRAEYWLEQILLRSLEPNQVSYSSVLKACARMGESEKVESWVEKMFEAGFQSEDLAAFQPKQTAGPRTGSPLRKALYRFRSFGQPELVETLEAALELQWLYGYPRVPHGELQLTHGTYKYLSGMQPLTVRRMLDLVPGARMVLDPFCGSGAVMIEALAQGKLAIGCDAFPLAIFVSYHHCDAGRPDLEKLKALALEVAMPINGKPKDWRQIQNTVDALPKSAEKNALWFALVVGLNIATQGLQGLQGVNVFGAGDASAARAYFVSAVQRYSSRVEDLRQMHSDDALRPDFHNCDVRDLHLATPVDAILTSPPYPGVYNYLTQNSNAQLSAIEAAALRDFGSATSDEVHGFDPGAHLEVQEIGARRSWASCSMRDFSAQWQSQQEQWLRVAHACLKTGGSATLMIGDGDSAVENGFDNLSSTIAAAETVGFEIVAWATIESCADEAHRTKGMQRTEHMLHLLKKDAESRIARADSAAVLTLPAVDTPASQKARTAGQQTTGIGIITGLGPWSELPISDALQLQIVATTLLLSCERWLDLCSTSRQCIHVNEGCRKNAGYAWCQQPAKLPGFGGSGVLSMISGTSLARSDGGTAGSPEGVKKFSSACAGGTQSGAFGELELVGMNDDNSRLDGEMHNPSFNKFNLQSSIDEKDTVSLSAALFMIIVMTLVFGVYSLEDHGLFMEILWIFSTYLESISMLPQYIYCYRDADNKCPLVSAYVFAMGGYQMVFGVSWGHHFLFRPYDLDVSSMISGFLGIVFFCDYLTFRVMGASMLVQVCISVDDTIKEAEEAAWSVLAGRGTPGIREEPVNPEVIGHRSDEIEMATGLVEHRSRTD